MELFLILVLGAIVVWLVSKRGADQQYTRKLYDLASRLEDRVLRLERAQELKAAASPPPEPQVRTQNVAQWTAPIPNAAAAQVSADVPASFPQPIARSQTRESALTGAPTMPEVAAAAATGPKTSYLDCISAATAAASAAVCPTLWLGARGVIAGDVS